MRKRLVFFKQLCIIMSQLTCMLCTGFKLNKWLVLSVIPLSVGSVTSIIAPVIIDKVNQPALGSQLH